MSLTARRDAGSGAIERLADQLARKFDVDTECILDKFSASTPSSPNKTVSTVHLSPVSTFVFGAKDRPFGYFVSSLARHWGVIVGDSDKFLYHLVFENQADVPSNTNPDSLTGKVRAVQFNCTDWDSSRSRPPSEVYAGKTRYSPYELLGIGAPQICDDLTGRKEDD
jgi:hypothetical protein